MRIFLQKVSTKKIDCRTGYTFSPSFTNDQLVNIFKRLKQQARIGIVVNDLHRHALAYYSIMWITRLFSKSEMVKIDAPLSVLRGFRRSEIISILNQAEITNYTLRWKWAFRWQLIIRV
ncbi:MAG: hypothetical protein HC811_03110 [Flammeovirgaceae bacterium]|nr:hypothetical protein [Flammeovirgaceae bacterium]